MHDSRGASLKVGDSVLVEAKVTALCSGDDTGFCNVTIQVVTPQQVKPPEMTPPTLSAINTRMLTKVAAVFALLLMACASANAQQPCVNGRCPLLPPAPAFVQQAGGIVIPQPMAWPGPVATSPTCQPAASASDQWYLGKRIHDARQSRQSKRCGR